MLPDGQNARLHFRQARMIHTELFIAVICSRDSALLSLGHEESTPGLSAPALVYPAGGPGKVLDVLPGLSAPALVDPAGGPGERRRTTKAFAYLSKGEHNCEGELGQK